MSQTITIPDSFYQEAAANIAAERRKNEGTVSADDIEAILRSYVFLGVNKQIVDWSSLLSDADKDSIVNAVVKRTGTFYFFDPTYAKTYVDLEILENLALNGLAAPNVARPRSSQEQYEAQLVEAHANDKNPIEQGVQNFFGVIKSGLQAALKGLGINIPVELIIGAVVLLVIVLLVRPARIA